MKKRMLFPLVIIAFLTALLQLAARTLPGFGEWYATGIYNSIVHWSPDLIVLGGAVSSSIPLDKVDAHLKEIQKVFPTTPKLIKASLGNEAGAYGALSVIKRR